MVVWNFETYLWFRRTKTRTLKMIKVGFAFFLSIMIGEKIMEIIHSMWNEYPFLKQELTAIRHLMIENIEIEDTDIQQAIVTMLQQGGKMIRPAYLTLFANWSNNWNQKQVRAVAAALELLHVATLLHDDVIDEADMRRGQETLNSRYGNRIAIYAGDYVLTSCYRLLSEHVENLEGISLPTNGMSRVVEGELNQMRNRYRVDLGLQEYLKRIEGKTAQLFMLSCYMGARLGQMDDALRAKKIGQQIGMAFQILDDILDYQVNSQEFGKPVLEDVVQGIYTAPLIYALEKESKQILPLLEKKQKISEQERVFLKKIVYESGGLRKAQQLAEKYTNQALSQIERLPESDMKLILMQVTKQLLERMM